MHTLGTIIKTKDVITFMELQVEHFKIHSRLFKVIKKDDLGIAGIAERSRISMEEVAI